MTIEVPEKSPSPLSLPPRLPLRVLYCLLVCFTALICLNLRTAWQEDWRTAKQKRYSMALMHSGHYFRLNVFSWHELSSSSSWLFSLFICMFFLLQSLNHYLIFWHLVTNASPTHAGGMWRTTEYTLACGCEILPTKTFINRKTGCCFYASTINVFLVRA